MSGLTKGPLSPEVYWRRRLLVLALALLLVFGIARVLGGGSGGSDGAGAKATQAGAETAVTATGSGSGSPAATPPSPTPSTKKQIRRAKKQAQKAAQKAAESAAAEAAAPASAAAQAALPDPQGPCSDSDVAVTPTVGPAVAGSDVTFDLTLNTRFSPACTWSISSDSLVVKVTSGPDNIWSTQQCPGAVPPQDVVLRRAVPTTVQVVWNTKRSDDVQCTARTTWVSRGFYHVLASALGGEPTDVQFELTNPVAPVVTKTVQPKTGKKKAQQPSQTG